VSLYFLDRPERGTVALSEVQRRHVSANLTEGGNLTIENRIVPYSVFTDRRLAASA